MVFAVGTTIARAHTVVPQVDGYIERSVGRVVDTDDDGVAYAAVVVMDMDSVMIGSAACDSQGFFSINLPQGGTGLMLLLILLLSKRLVTDIKRV